jgi:hypothetical protein
VTSASFSETSAFSFIIWKVSHIDKYVNRIRTLLSCEKLTLYLHETAEKIEEGAEVAEGIRKKLTESKASAITPLKLFAFVNLSL